MRSLRTKMVLAFAAPVALLLVIFALILTYQIENTIIPLSEEMSGEIVLNRAVQVEGRLQEYVREAVSISKEFFSGYAIDVRTLEESRIPHYKTLIRSNIASRWRALREGIYGVYYVDYFGNYYGGDGSEGFVEDSEYFQAILVEDRDAFVLGPYAKEDGELVLDVTTELINDEGNKVGLLGIQVPFEGIRQLVEAGSIGGQGYGWVVDSKGLIIAHPDESVFLKMNVLACDQEGYQGVSALGEKMFKNTSGSGTVVIPDGEKHIAFFETVPGPSGWTLAISLPLEAIMGRTAGLRLFTLVAFSILFVFTVLVALIMSNNIAKPVKEVAHELNSIAEGDLRQYLDLVRNDEVGQMAGSFNKMVNTLQDMVARITTVIEAISHDTQSLAAIAEDNSAALTEVSTTMVEFATTAERSSSHALSMSGQAQDALTLTNRGMEQIEFTGGIMATIEETSRDSALAIKALENETAKIDDMIDSISDIAEQTNLLALNAAIEAARAGEEGRGFSVVAQEVRKLAEQTQTLVTEVRETMDTLRLQAENAVRASEANTREVDQGQGALSETQEAFLSIARNIEETVRSFNEVASATEELSEGSGEISAATERQIGSVAEVVNVAESVGRMIEELKNLVDMFEV